MGSLEDLCEQLGYQFHNPSLLKAALTHPSMLGGRKDGAFERMEFLGDRVLGVVVATLLYEKFPHETEGDLAKRHAALVNKETCLEVAEQINLERYLKAAAADMTPHSAILSDALEALLAALYLDGGLPAAARFIETQWAPLLLKNRLPPKDAKSALQEWAQAHLPDKRLPLYKVIQTKGAAHAPTFTVEVQIDERLKATATGASKRQAEQEAARHLLEKLKP